MEAPDLFTAALKLSKPWKVTRTQFDAESEELHLYVDFPRGAHFSCPTCQKLCPIHDTSEKIWRHLDFFQHKAYLHVRVPRSECPAHGVLQIELPWSRPNSGFTLLFETLITTLARSMPVLAIARLTGEHDTRLWRSIHHQVDDARSKVDMKEVTVIGMDETSVRKHHKYITIFSDIATSKVLFATPGKGHETIIPFKIDFALHGGVSNNIKQVSMDMSPAFIKGVTEYLPQAVITFDKFHVFKIVSFALEEVRRAEQRESPKHYELLKGSRYSLLKNIDNLNQKDTHRVEKIAYSNQNIKTGRAWRMKKAFSEIYNLHGQEGVNALEKWCSWAVRSQLRPMIEVARTIKAHWDGVISYFSSGLTNAVLESTNASFQAARAIARGYRNPVYAIAILYLIAGKLNIPTLNKTHTK
jgi:transposase